MSLLLTGAGTSLSYTSVFQDYLDKIEFEGGSLTALEKLFINQFTIDYDVRAHKDVLVILGLQNAIAAKVNLPNPSFDLADWINSPTFTAGFGVNGNGSTSLINLKYSPGINGVLYTLNNCSYGFYGRTNSLVNGYDMGVDNCVFASKWGDTLFYAQIQSGSAFTAFNSNSSGLYNLVRTASNLSTLYKNGVSVGTGAVPSSALSSRNFYLGCRNASGTPANYTPRQFSAYWTGTGTEDQTAFNTAFQNLAVNLGFNV